MPESISYFGQSTLVCLVFYAFLQIGEREATWRVAVGLAVCLPSILYLALQDYGVALSSAGATQYVKELTTPKLVELPKGVEQTMPIENRKPSIYVAKSAYTNHGKIIEYITEAGEQVPYHPTEADVKDRDRLVAGNASLDLVSAQAANSKYRWSIFSLVAILFGFAAGGFVGPRRNERGA